MSTEPGLICEHIWVNPLQILYNRTFRGAMIYKEIPEIKYYKDLLIKNAWTNIIPMI